MNPVWTSTSLNGDLLFGLNLVQGAQFFLRVTGEDLGGNGDRDEFAMDNLSITAIPESSAAALGLVGLLGYVSRRRRTSGEPIL